MKEIICAGFGGQGVLVAGMIIIYAGMGEGKQVTWFPSYGAEMRGGTANCTVKISEEEIASPYVKQIDVLMAMNETSIDKFESKLRPNGVLLVNSSIVSPNREYRDDIRVIQVPANDIAAQTNNPKGLNIIMLGALAEATDIFEKDYLKKSMNQYFADKGKKNPKNDICFDEDKKIISIDGGTGVKFISQLNALIIEKDDQGLHFKQHEVQPLPVYQIKKDYFVEKKEIHKVAWPHFEIKILEKKDEFSLCRVLDKNDVLWIKNEFIYEKKKHYYCLDDYIDAFLSVKKGDLIKVVGIYHNWVYIKYKNEIGWIPIKILDE